MFCTLSVNIVKGHIVSLLKRSLHVVIETTMALVEKEVAEGTPG